MLKGMASQCTGCGADLCPGMRNEARGGRASSQSERRFPASEGGRDSGSHCSIHIMQHVCHFYHRTGTRRGLFRSILPTSWVCTGQPGLLRQKSCRPKGGVTADWPTADVIEDSTQGGVPASGTPPCVLSGCYAPMICMASSRWTSMTYWMPETFAASSVSAKMSLRVIDARSNLRLPLMNCCRPTLILSEKV